MQYPHGYERVLGIILDHKDASRQFKWEAVVTTIHFVLSRSALSMRNDSDFDAGFGLKRSDPMPEPSAVPDCAVTIPWYMRLILNYPASLLDLTLIRYAPL